MQGDRRSHRGSLRGAYGVEELLEGYVEEIAEATVNFRVAHLIYDARMVAGMTQQQLAHRVGTKQSVIARLEDADYEGHSLRT